MLGDNYPHWVRYDFGYYMPKEIKKILSKTQMYDYIRDCIRKNGLEGAEEVIKRVYNTVPKIRQDYLQMLYEIWKG